VSDCPPTYFDVRGCAGHRFISGTGARGHPGDDRIARKGCDFSQTIFYYPALLGYVASTLACVIDRRLAGHGVYTAAVIIVVLDATDVGVGRGIYIGGDERLGGRSALGGVRVVVDGLSACPKIGRCEH
jgi:hypothetical protein